MPVTAKLSRQFYEKLGEQIANELVEWFNSVDATYRADLRELNELNYSRFEAKLEQHIAEFRAELKSELASLRRDLMGDLAGKGEVQALKGEVQALKDEVQAVKGELHPMKAELIKWMFLFWTGTTLAGLIFR